MALELSTPASKSLESIVLHGSCVLVYTQVTDRVAELPSYVGSWIQCVPVGISAILQIVLDPGEPSTGRTDGSECASCPTS